jgi:light-regulated signal transduction histidine kinase (bacteriophytochrome)
LLAKKDIIRIEKIKQISPVLLDLQSYFLQIKALSESKDNRIDEINLLSRHALNILDYAFYLTQYEQTELPLTTISGAAVVQSVASELNQFAKAYNVELELDITKTLEPVYSNEHVMRGALYGLLSSLIAGCGNPKKSRIIIAAQETTPTTQRYGVYSSDIVVNPKIIRLARAMVGKARSMTPTELHTSGLGLLIADESVNSINSQLNQFSHKGNKGVGFYLPMSTQLSLV